MRTLLFLTCIPALLHLNTAQSHENEDWDCITLMREARTCTPSATEALDKLLRQGADPNKGTTDGHTPLMAAANKCNLEAVRLLLNAGADAGATSKHGTNALHLLACAAFFFTEEKEAKETERMEQIAELLIKAGANIHQADKDGLTPIAYAAGGHPKLVKKLAEAGATLPEEGTEAHRRMMTHCLNFNYKTIPALLEAGLNPNYTEDNGESLLEKCADARNTAAVKALLQTGADVHHLNKYGNCVLSAIRINYRDKKAAEARYKIAQLLLDAGANPLELRGLHNKSNLLHTSASTGDCEILRMILQKYPNATEIPDSDGHTALLRAARASHPEAVRILLKAGANPNAEYKDPRAMQTSHFGVAAAAALSDKDTALTVLRDLLSAGAKFDAEAQKSIMYSAVQYGRADVVHFLLTKGVDVHARLAHDIPYIQVAVQNKNKGIIEALISAGANVNAANNHGLTALHWAISGSMHGNDHAWYVVSLLLQNGADLYVKDFRGKTPLDMATSDMLMKIQREFPDKIRQ